MIENTINNIEITPVNEKKAEVMIVFKSGSLHSSESVIPALGQEKLILRRQGMNMLYIQEFLCRYCTHIWNSFAKVTKSKK